METVLRVHNLTKEYKGFTAVDHISFEVKAGEIVGLIGPNGAGKTTTVQMLLSLIEPTKGSIEMFGKDLKTQREEALRKVNFVAPYAPLPYHLSIEENLLVFALLYNVKPTKATIDALLKEFRLEEFRHKKSGVLSSGEQTRLGLAKAFITDPKLLLLDEPTASLDPLTARDMRNAIYYRAKEHKGAVLWTSHNMKEIENMCDRVIFLIHGKIVAQDAPKNLLFQYGKGDLEEVFLMLSEEKETIRV